MTMPRNASGEPQWLMRDDHAARSLLLPGEMLHTSRAQRGLADGQAPRICLLDPDGDILDALRQSGHLARSPSWGCFHTELWQLGTGDQALGVVGRAVGAPFAVMVAEELFATGCELVIHVASAGRLDDREDAGERPGPRLIAAALRGDGTSHAYLAPAPTVRTHPRVAATAERALAAAGIALEWVTTWTTDAPFRETRRAIEQAVRAGARVVEMEAAGLLAFAEATGNPVLCMVQVTNRIDARQSDFDKGPGAGVPDTLRIVEALAGSWFADAP